MVADLPVGENLQDHVMTFLEFHDNTTRVATKPKIETPWNIMQYLLFKTGNTFFLHLGNIGTHRFFSFYLQCIVVYTIIIFSIGALSKTHSEGIAFLGKNTSLPPQIQLHFLTFMYRPEDTNVYLDTFNIDRKVCHFL